VREGSVGHGEEAALTPLRPTGPQPIVGYLFELDRIEKVALAPADPMGEISRRIGAPSVNCFTATEDLSLWVGDSTVIYPENALATSLERRLLRAVATGEYPVSLADLDRITRILREPWRRPMIRGACLVVGAGPDGGVDSVPQQFAGWWEDIKNRWVAQLSSELAVPLGIPPGKDSVIQAVPSRPDS
jgi:hypothetical protein